MPVDARLLLHELGRSGFEVRSRVVQTEQDYRDQLQTPPELVITDFSLPQFDGRRALEILQELDLDIPLLIVSGAIGEEVGVECMKLGAADYLLKDRLGRLGQAVEHALAERRLRADKRAAEQALRDSEQRFRLLAEHARDLIYLYRVSPVSGFDYVSPSATVITGYPPEAYLADADLAARLIHPDEQSSSAAFTTAGPSDEPLVTRIRHRDGHDVWIELQRTPVYDQAGALVAVEGIARDITSRHQAEQALIAQALREQDLRQAKLSAEQASQAKSEYLSRMSHELRTPLNAILGFAQLLELDDLDNQQHDSVAHILAAGEHLLTLINEILDITAIESRRLPLVLEPVAVGDALVEVIGLVRPLAEQCGVLLMAPPPTGEVHVMADRHRLTQILLNLVSNAIKYNRPDGAVHIECGPMPCERFRITVADTGFGIPPEMIDRLFAPFERLGKESTEVKGTGLGLHISRRLAEAMSGTLEVASTVDAGSRFWIELPLAQRPAEREQARQLAPLSGQEQSVIRPALTVLCIEDNPSNLELVERVLSRLPCVRFLSATRPQAGLDLAAQQRPDLILLDLHLPDIPGEELLRRLRAEPSTSGIPVVVTSADAQPSLVTRLIDQGAQAFLTKPINVRELLGVVDTIRPAAHSRAP